MEMSAFECKCWPHSKIRVLVSSSRFLGTSAVTLIHLARSFVSLESPPLLRPALAGILRLKLCCMNCLVSKCFLGWKNGYIF